MTPVAHNNLTVVKAAIQLWKQAGIKRWHTVSGTSMQPLLCPGDQVQVETLPCIYSVGDIVLFQLGGMWTIHRIVEKYPDGHFLVWGDSNRTADPLIGPEDIVGRVVARTRDQQTVRLDALRYQLFGHYIIWTNAIRRPIIRVRRLLKLGISATQRTALSGTHLLEMKNDEGLN